jgi:predicted transcriptional regulator
MTPNEKIIEEKYHKLQAEHSELKDKYDQLCGKLKRNANDSRNEGDAFLSTYNSSGRRVPWE